jgi:arylsulfatase A-like enzyme
MSTMDSTSDRPNIVVIVSDDQDAWALGSAGNHEIHTPALDALASQGVRMDRFFCASPVCSPARASLLTGRMPSAHGVHDWIRGEAYGVVEADDERYLAGLSTTPEVLASAGWRCGYSGKWHLGSAREPARGFDFWYAHRTGDGPYHGAPVWVDGRRVSEPRYITDAITDEALHFIDESRASDAPFYLAVNYTAPHSPWTGQHLPEDLARYADCDFETCPQEEPHPWFSWEPGPVSDAMRDPRPSLQGYFASITAMDRGIGRIVSRLDELGLRDSTIVVFTSDNGFSCGHHGIWGKGNATWPLNLWERSVRVPFIISRPGRIPAGRVLDDLASACDLHPTLLELAGVPAPADPLGAGTSMMNPLLGDTGVRRDAVTVFDEYGGTRMVRTADWKYVTRAQGPSELYHLADDPEEQVNLIEDPRHAARVDEHHAVLVDWFREHTDAHLDAFARPISGRGQLRPVRLGLDDSQTYQPGGAERRTTH